LKALALKAPVVKAAALSFTLCSAATVALAPVANATLGYGNFDLQIQRGTDYHTYVWAVTPCVNPAPDCRTINAIHRPIAGNVSYAGEAHLVNGQWTLGVDIGEGLICGGYYGQNIPTHDTFTWDANTLVGSADSASDIGCGGAPGGVINYPFVLSRL
jgi:hypothetical protein